MTVKTELLSAEELINEFEESLHLYIVSLNYSPSEDKIEEDEKRVEALKGELLKRLKHCNKTA